MEEGGAIPNDEEWIELHNRGESVVNLAGWSLADAVEFEFPADSKIDPGGYVVVARDADALRDSRSSSFENLLESLFIVNLSLTFRAFPKRTNFSLSIPHLINSSRKLSKA